MSSLLEMYDALICTNTSPELGPLPNLATNVDFSKRKSTEASKGRTSTEAAKGRTDRNRTDIKRSATNSNLDRKRPPDPPPAPPNVPRPLSVSSMASLSSTSSSSGKIRSLSIPYSLLSVLTWLLHFLDNYNFPA